MLINHLLYVDVYDTFGCVIEFYVCFFSNTSFASLVESLCVMGIVHMGT